MEKTIDEFLDDIAEATDNFEATAGFKLSKEDVSRISERLAKIIEFENTTSDINNLKNLIKDLKRYQSIDNELDDESDDTVKFEVSTALQKKMKEVEKILNSKNVDELTVAEERKIQDFTDKLADEFKKFQTEAPTDYKETGVNTFKIKFEQSFPVRLQIDGKNYYGLVRPPTGIITWQGPTARAKAKEVGVPIKLPIMNVGNKKAPEFKVKRGADAFGKFMSKFQDSDNIDFDFDDSTGAKQKVIQALEKAGISFKTDNYQKRGALKGVEDAISNMKLSDMIEESLVPEEQDLTLNEGLTKNVKFWKNIAEIL
ncbi:MAG: hypothetical protein ACOC3V_04805 [bacterium]